MNLFLRKSIRLFLFVLFSLSAISNGHCQSINDECQDAFKILDPIDWCSNLGEFSNTEATPSGFGAPTCFDATGSDVWFTFRAFATAINIVINSTGQANSQVALYSGSCSTSISELACASDINNLGAISILENGLTIGENYLIRVSARANVKGTFQICTNNFNPPIEPGQDCNTGSILCDKSPFVVQVLSGGGANPDEGDGTCLEGGNPNTITEDQSSWMKWTAGTNGSLTFTITPLNSRDDIDFALFELTDIDQCINTNPLRCVATSCSGPTGLNLTSVDLTEDFNCEPNEDGFVQFIDMEAGRHYGLLINNFSNSSIGYKIEFGGTGEFLGPLADFSIAPDTGLRCDQDFTITNKSTFPNGNIVGFEWNFGERAIPPGSNLAGPHKINYESFGDKFIVLTVVSDKGCRVTSVLPLTAEPCCDDVDMIDIEAIAVNDPLCSYLENGSVLVQATGTNLEYTYNINDSEYIDSPSFSSLPAGSYKIGVIDIKGCKDSLIVDLMSPDPILVDAGLDSTIQLGFDIQLEGEYSQVVNEIICWTPPEGLSDSMVINPIASPFGATTYTLTIKDENGCSASDQVTINTDVDRNIYAPNIFSPFIKDGINDYFNLFGDLSVDNIDQLAIFDRWGNKIYDEYNLNINARDQGWDGRFNGQKVNPGVYVWYAKVKFLDRIVVDYAGDVTIIE